jgi:hypothetical protein
VKKPDKTFIPSDEQLAIINWLERRRESWPEKFRAGFFPFLRTTLEHMEHMGDEADAAKEKKK